MTLPTITYANDFEENCTNASKYTETEDGATAAISSDNGYFDINVTQVAGNKIVYYKLTTAISVSSNVYGKITFRYKTSTENIKAKIQLDFSSGNQVVLAETSNTDWTVATVSIDANKTIQHIRFYATQATGHVYYDFALIHKGTAEFKDFKHIHFHNERRIANQDMWGRGGFIQQEGGLLSSDITIDGVMKSGETWGSETYPYGEFLLDGWRKGTFCWFTCDAVKCLVKVRVVDVDQEDVSATQRTFHVELSYYTKSELRQSIWDGTAWLGY